MIEQTQTWLELTNFIESIIGKPIIGENNLTRNTDLYHDLDMNAEKIKSVINIWAEKFHVDISNFDIARYYPGSKLTAKQFILTLAKSPFSRRAREILGGWQLTLGMLEDAMLTGKWQD